MMSEKDFTSVYAAKGKMATCMSCGCKFCLEVQVNMSTVESEPVLGESMPMKLPSKKYVDPLENTNTKFTPSHCPGCKKQIGRIFC